MRIVFSHYEWLKRGSHTRLRRRRVRRRRFHPELAGSVGSEGGKPGVWPLVSLPRSLPRFLVATVPDLLALVDYLSLSVSIFAFPGKARGLSALHGPMPVAGCRCCRCRSSCRCCREDFGETRVIKSSAHGRREGLSCARSRAIRDSAEGGQPLATIRSVVY